MRKQVSVALPWRQRRAPVSWRWSVGCQHGPLHARFGWRAAEIGCFHADPVQEVVALGRPVKGGTPVLHGRQRRGPEREFVADAAGFSAEQNHRQPAVQQRLGLPPAERCQAWSAGEAEPGFVRQHQLVLGRDAGAVVVVLEPNHAPRVLEVIEVLCGQRSLRSQAAIVIGDVPFGVRAVDPGFEAEANSHGGRPGHEILAQPGVRPRLFHLHLLVLTHGLALSVQFRHPQAGRVIGVPAEAFAVQVRSAHPDGGGVGGARLDLPRPERCAFHPGRRYACGWHPCRT